MKVLTVILPVLLLQFALHVSSQSTSNLLAQLIDLVNKENSSAYDDIATQYDKTISRITTSLENNALPSINQITNDLEEYVEDLANQTSSAGYDTEECINSFKEVVSSGQALNITQTAISELTEVYIKIVSNVLFAARRNIDAITRERDSIATETTRCLLSTQPEYCNRTLNDLLSAKIDVFPAIYQKEIQRTNLAFIREVGRYESRIQDLVEGVITVTKPYLYLLESCVAVVFASWQDNGNN